jgi:hypothetical protein
VSTGDKLSYAKQPKAWLARQNRWKHNSFLGHAGMMWSNATSIMNSYTATDESKALAREIYSLAEKLQSSLRKRRDQVK